MSTEVLLAAWLSASVMLGACSGDGSEARHDGQPVQQTSEARPDAVEPPPAPLPDWRSEPTLGAAALAALAERRTVVWPGDEPRSRLRFEPKLGVDEYVGFRVHAREQLADGEIVEKTPAYYLNRLRVESLADGHATLIVQRMLQYAAHPTESDQMLGEISRLEQAPRRAELDAVGQLSPEPLLFSVFMQAPRLSGFADHLILAVPESDIGVGARWEFVGVRPRFDTAAKYRVRGELLARDAETVRVWIAIDEIPSPQYEGSETMLRGQGELTYRLDRLQPVAGRFAYTVEYHGEPDCLVPGDWPEWHEVEFEALDEDGVAAHRKLAEPLAAHIDTSIEQARAWAEAEGTKHP